MGVEINPLQIFLLLNLKLNSLSIVMEFKTVVATSESYFFRESNFCFFS